MTDYNGAPNRATWNAWLSLTGWYESTYKLMCHYIREAAKANKKAGRKAMIYVDDAKWITRACLGQEWTFDHDPLSDVHWGHIARHMNEVLRGPK